MKVKSDKFQQICKYLTAGKEYEVIRRRGEGLYDIKDDDGSIIPIRTQEDSPSSHTSSVWYVVKEEAGNVLTYQELEDKVKKGEHLILKVTKGQDAKVQELWFSLDKIWFTGPKGFMSSYWNNTKSDYIYLFLEDTLTWSYDFTGNQRCIYSLKEDQQITSFNTQQEIWEYLIEGGEVISDTGVKYKLINGAVHTLSVIADKYKIGGVSFSLVNNYKPYIEPKWYDNIPEQGILCWVWDTLDGTKDVGIIHSIEKDQEGKPTQYLDNYSRCPWDNAIPVTEEEVKKYVYKEQ